MRDVILHIKDLTEFLAYVLANHPELLAYDGEGVLLDPITLKKGSRTPAVIKDNQALVYARVTQDEYVLFNSCPGASVLAEEEFVGSGTAASLYGQVFSDEEKLSIYDAVYPRSPYLVDYDGMAVRRTPPDWFGVVSGA